MNQATLPGVAAEIDDPNLRDSWCTPPWVWRIPLLALGIDRYNLDPCSNDRSSVPAKRSICPPDNGLEVKWRGAVWLNPPYSDVSRWFVRAVYFSRLSATPVFGVVPLTPGIAAWRINGPDYAWPLGRVHFEPPPGVAPSSPNQEHALVLWTRPVDPPLESVLREIGSRVAFNTGNPYRMTRHVFGAESTAGQQPARGGEVTPP